MAAGQGIIVQSGSQPDDNSVSDDAFLGGKISILQPAKGYRAGIDAVLLAATVSAAAEGSRILDMGAGVGTAGLCVAARLPGVHMTLLEREAALAELAAKNIERNSLGNRCTVIAADLTSSPAGLEKIGLASESFDAAIANPPFHDEARGTASASPLKGVSHAMPEGDIEQWVRFAVRILKAKSPLTIIHKATALDEILAALSRRFGAITICPVQAFADAPAIRIIIRAVKGSKAPLTIVPPLVLHTAPGRFTPMVEDILRNGRNLDLNATV